MQPLILEVHVYQVAVNLDAVGLTLQQQMSAPNTAP